MNSPESCRYNQKGVAIVMALLVVALIAGIAAAMLSDYGHAISHLSGRHDLAQARWLARGGVDWARSILENDYKQDGANGVDTLREEWSVKIPPTPVEEGEISGAIEELSGRFNINTLVNAGKPNPAQRAIFMRLLLLLGHPENEAVGLSEAVTLWLAQASTASGDPQSTVSYPVPPSVPLLHLDELKMIDGWTAERVEQIRAFVTALPEEVKAINVNMAPAVVIAAHIENLSLAEAQVMTFDRERAFFTSTGNFISRLPANTHAQEGLFTVRSHYFMVNVRASWGVSVTQLQVLLRRNNARPDILWERLL